MAEDSTSRVGCGQWFIFLAVAGWLAAVPLAVSAALAALTGHPPDLLVQLEVIPPAEPVLSELAFGLLTTTITLGLDLFVLVPLYRVSRRPGREFVRTASVLGIATALFQALNAFSRLLWPTEGPDLLGTDPLLRLAPATLRLVVSLLFLLFGLGWIEARSQKGAWARAWRRVGLRGWLSSSPLWLALFSGAVVGMPWVLVGSLGSPGATMLSGVQAMHEALGEEILFRGFALAWLWRVIPSRTGAVVASWLWFVAAQGGTVLPVGDWGAIPRFGAALLLGLLLTELVIRADGSIWPAVVLHFLYSWFSRAFVDPRSEEEILHWVVRMWAPLAAGGLGILFLAGRKIVKAVQGDRALRKSRAGTAVAAGSAGGVWAVLLVLYFTLGVPGFHPDGFLIVLEEQADLSPAVSITDPVERRAWVYRTLVETAERSQSSLRAELDRRGVAYRPHYLINMIEVQERPFLRWAFARKPGVAFVLFQPGMRRYPRGFQVPDLDPQGPSGVEWNVREVGADRVWQLGYTGQGVIVGDADTGVAWDHPALKAAYRGWDGSTVRHDYHWYDAWDGRAEPWDDNGHGTHTTGIMVGQDGENQIGVAPGARWIACRNMRHGIGHPGAYITCMEFLLAPFPVGGDPFHDGDPTQGAHVVNNSWGCPKKEGCLPDTLRRAVENLRMAGQMMVVSAGNDGPACGTVQDPPALYDAVLSVGAIGRGDRVAGFSSRGPVTADGSQRLKPDLVAPGLDIRSSVPGGYAILPGTSMAGPHVAGVVALLWSIEPELIGDIDRTEVILTETAQHLVVDAVCPSGGGSPTTVCACGDQSPDAIPNHVYGWGQVDAWAAAQRLLGR